MAPARSKAQPQIGSAQWISEEQENINRFGNQEVEDFLFAARNEVDWLNEHMAEVFSTNQLCVSINLYSRRCKLTVDRNVTEIFKTPGKLRGKTPRTTRKRNPLENRLVSVSTCAAIIPLLTSIQPLSDVFSANIRSNPSPLHVTQVFKAFIACEVSEDLTSAPLKVPEAGASRFAKQNADSGYHGMTEDEMDIDPVPSTAITTESNHAESSHIALQVPDVKPAGTRPSDDRRTTEGSFHSATEELTSRVAPKPSPLRDVPAAENTNEEHSEEDIQLAPITEVPLAEVDVITETQGEHTEKDSLLDVDPAVDDSPLSSGGSSPVRPLVRKSSLTFASLPAREPLTTKKSIGARVSRTSHLDQSKVNPLNRGSIFGRFTGGKSLGGTQQQPQEDESRMDDDEKIDRGGHNDEDVEMVDDERPALTREESDGDAKITKLHNKSSTQRLHERINMLGQSQPPRPTKSIPATATVAVQASYPDLTSTGVEEIQALERSNALLPKQNTARPIDDDDDDDWIKPPPPQLNEQRHTQLSKEFSAAVTEDVSAKNSNGSYESGLGPHERHEAKEPLPSSQSKVTSKQSNGLVLAKSTSAPNLISPSRVTTATEKTHEVDNSASNQVPSSLTDTDQMAQPKTTAGSPTSRRHLDGPLSASKSKLQSIMKTARGLFTSSAGISAQAKMETFSPRSMRSRGPAQGPIHSARTDVGLYPDLQNAKAEFNMVDDIPGNPLKKCERLRTRCSTEKEDMRREKEVNDRERVESELEKARENERQKAAKYKDELNKTACSKKIAPFEQEQATEGTVSAPSQPQAATRKSPRRLQNRGEPRSEIEVTQSSAINAVQEEAADTMLALPPRMQTHSQIQRPKDFRRPVKPAREAAPKPKPQPVAIRVGTLSQRIPLNNTILSSTLQDSLPPPQSQPAGVVRKPSSASIQTSVSGISQKSSVSSTSTKPKALLAAERKKEQVSLGYVAKYHLEDVR